MATLNGNWQMRRNNLGESAGSKEIVSNPLILFNSFFEMYLPYISPALR